MTGPVEECRRLGAELRLLRDLKGLGGREMARRIGISQSKLSRIELGAALPSEAEVTAWAEALGAPEETERLLETLTDAVRIEAESRLRSRNVAEPLNIGVRQLSHREDRIREVGVTADDLPQLVDYMAELAEHGYSVAELALHAIDRAPPPHPVFSTHEGMKVQEYLGHVRELFGIAQSFVQQSYSLLSNKTGGPPNAPRVPGYLPGTRDCGSPAAKGNE